MAKVTKTKTVYLGNEYFHTRSNSGSYIDISTVSKRANMSDNNLSTYCPMYTNNSPGYHGFLLDLSDIPLSAEIKEVRFKTAGCRTDSSSSCAFRFNLFASDNTTNNTFSGKTAIFAGDTGDFIVPSLFPYNRDYISSWMTDIIRTPTEQQSATILSTPYPTLIIYFKGHVHVAEFWIQIKYEVEENNHIFVGTTPISAVYVGTTKASAVYVGTTKVL